MNVKEFVTVHDMVNDPCDNLCHHDAVAQYVFDVYGKVHGVDGHRLDTDDIDWESWNRIITYITSRFIELGREDHGEEFEMIIRDINEYEETDFGYELRDGDRIVAQIYKCYHDCTLWGWHAYQFEDDKLFGRGDTPQEALDNMMVCDEVEYYSIEEDDCKVIHYTGCDWWHDDEGFNEQEIDFCYLPVDEYNEDRLILAAEYCQQCVWESDHIDIEGRTYLPLREVNEDTPCGDYWCPSTEM